MAVTIKDVAKHAGVTIGTVSRAINGYKDISPATKERVFASVEALGYTPNVIARGLSSKTNTNMGVIISGLLNSNLKDNLWYMMLQGIYRYTSRYNIEISIYTTDSSQQKRKSYRQFCRERNLAGAILSGITTTDPYFEELMQADIPCVVIDVAVIGQKAGCISIDNIQASREMVEYLIHLGHQRFVVIAGKKETSVTLERMAGIRQGLLAHGLELDGSDILYCDFNETTAFQKVKEYVAEYRKTRGLCFVCMSDVMAIGAIRALNECGYRVPDDFSVTGFDDIPLAEFLRPALTTVRQDFNEFGYQSARLLKKIIQNQAAPQHLYIPHQIITRESVRPY